MMQTKLSDIRVPLKERQPFLHLKYGALDVQDGAVVLSDATGVRMQIPVGTIACLMLEPGTTITHAAVKACAEVDCLILWVGEAGTRLYAAGQFGGSRADKLLFQLGLASTSHQRLGVVREMFRRRFKDDVPERRSVEQLRGLEGARARQIYQNLADEYGVKWSGRRYDPSVWGNSNDINRAISSANACLYALAECAVLVAGYSPAVGFIHTGKALSFVYDIADLYKFDVSVPVAFEVVRDGVADVEGEVRRRLRTRFQSTRLMESIIPDIEDILEVGAETRRDRS
jgi:CRISPR-associated protein Cas1